MELKMRVGDLVAKCNEYEHKLKEITDTISDAQGNNYFGAEVINRAEKDQRYPIKILVQEHKRLSDNLNELQDCTVEFIHD